MWRLIVLCLSLARVRVNNVLVSDVLGLAIYHFSSSTEIFRGVYCINHNFSIMTTQWRYRNNSTCSAESCFCLFIEVLCSCLALFSLVFLVFSCISIFSWKSFLKLCPSTFRVMKNQNQLLADKADSVAASVVMISISSSSTILGLAVVVSVVPDAHISVVQ